MKVEILGLDMRVNDMLRTAIEQKISKFERFFDESARGEVKLQPEGPSVRAEVTFKVQSLYFRAESVAGDAMTAVEQAIDNMEGQIRKNKARMKKRLKDPRGASKCATSWHERCRSSSPGSQGRSSFRCDLSSLSPPYS